MTADTTGGNNSSMVLQVDNKIAWTNAISHSYTNDLRDILDYYRKYLISFVNNDKELNEEDIASIVQILDLFKQLTVSFIFMSMIVYILISLSLSLFIVDIVILYIYNILCINNK